MSDAPAAPSPTALRPRPLDPHNAPDLKAVVDLHAELLGTGPIALLGKTFMHDFYYRRLVEGGIVRVHLAFDGNTPVGFIAWTAEQELGAAIQRRFPIRFALAMAKSVLSKPARLDVIWSLLRFSRVRGPKTDHRTPNEREGELISLGVLPEFTTRKYLAQTKRRHSLELLREALEGLRAAGVERYHGYVEKKNTPMLFVYQGLGCTLVPVAGMPTIRVEGSVQDALDQLPPHAG